MLKQDDTFDKMQEAYDNQNDNLILEDMEESYNDPERASILENNQRLIK